MTRDESLRLLALPEAMTRRWIGQLGEPQRHYHTLAHIERMLGDVPADAATREMLAAIWLHDIVYDPQASDNEERSAAQARVDLAGSDIDVETVAALILSTKRHDAADATQRLLGDLDLAILGAEPGDYDRYADGIRREYAHVPDAAYAAGRPAVLRHFLDRPRIYHTAAFADREFQARANLTVEIERLEQGG